MSEENTMPINVWLLGRSYKLLIKPQEEEIIRKAIKIANDKINRLRVAYSGKDEQDILAIMLVEYAANTAIEIKDNPLITEEIDRVVAKIDAVLEGE